MRRILFNDHETHGGISTYLQPLFSSTAEHCWVKQCSWLKCTCTVHLLCPLSIIHLPSTTVRIHHCLYLRAYMLVSLFVSFCDVGCNERGCCEGKLLMVRVPAGQTFRLDWFILFLELVVLAVVVLALLSSVLAQVRSAQSVLMREGTRVPL